MTDALAGADTAEFDIEQARRDIEQARSVAANEYVAAAALRQRADTPRRGTTQTG
jgi:hypothetical protein